MNSKFEPTLAEDYAAKKFDYFASPRPEMLDSVPNSCKRVLDIGCGSGAFGAGIRQRYGAEVWGIEPSTTACEQAAKVLDKAICACFGPELPLPRGYFDCVIFNDVLEHMLAPEETLKAVRPLLTNDAFVIASIPNIGNFPIVWDLVFNGEWEYKERGILDKTHFRFFTERSIRRMFQNEGYCVNEIRGINPFFNMEPQHRKRWWFYHIVRWLPIKGIHDMRYLQFAVIASLSQGSVR